MNGGLSYHFGADVVLQASGAMTVKLTSEFDSAALPAGVLRQSIPANIEIGSALFPVYYDGSNLKERYGIRIKTVQFVAVIVPGSFQIQSELASWHWLFQGSVILSNGYPDNCTGASALFGGQVPCEADASIIIQ
jgi:hypothetical protein